MIGMIIDEESKKSLIPLRGNSLEKEIFNYLKFCKKMKVDGFQNVQKILGNALRQLKSEDE